MPRFSDRLKRNDYISDFDFYAPKNYLKKPQLIKWFDYKLTTYYVLSAFKEYMPRLFVWSEIFHISSPAAGIIAVGGSVFRFSVLKYGIIMRQIYIGPSADAGS